MACSTWILKGLLGAEGKAKELISNAEALSASRQRDAVPLSSLELKGKGEEGVVIAP